MHFLCGNNAPKMITIYPEKHCALTMLYPNIVPEARFDKNRISNKNFAYPAGGGCRKAIFIFFSYQYYLLNRYRIKVVFARSISLNMNIL